MYKITIELKGYNSPDSDKNRQRDGVVRSMIYVLSHVGIITINNLRPVIEALTAPILKQPKPISGKIEDLYK